MGVSEGDWNPEIANESGVAEETESETDHEGTKRPEVEWSIENWLLIGLFFALTILGMAMSAGIIRPEFVEVTDIDQQGAVSVPLFVYLYASLGALGYIFTRLITRLDDFVEWGNIEKLVKMGLRIPAAWILAAGVYLFLPLFGVSGEATGMAWHAAGMAFLVGLYVNVAFKSLGGLAERLLGHTDRKPSEEG